MKSDGKKRARKRSLGLEQMESRRLLATSAHGLATHQEPGEIAASPDEDPAVRFRMEVTDRAGSPLDSTQTADEFFVNVYVQDVREDAEGVFAAYLDLTFDSDRIVRSGEVVFGDRYPNVIGLGGSTPGLLDEVGGVSGSILPLGSEEFLLFRAPFRALDQGPISFVAEPADNAPRSLVLVYGGYSALEPHQIDFGSAEVAVLLGGRGLPLFPWPMFQPVVPLSLLAERQTFSAGLGSNSPEVRTRPGPSGYEAGNLNRHERSFRSSSNNVPSGSNTNSLTTTWFDRYEFHGVIPAENHSRPSLNQSTAWDPWIELDLSEPISRLIDGGFGLGRTHSQRARHRDQSGHDWIKLTDQSNSAESTLEQQGVGRFLTAGFQRISWADLARMDHVWQRWSADSEMLDLAEVAYAIGGELANGSRLAAESEPAGGAETEPGSVVTGKETVDSGRAVAMAFDVGDTQDLSDSVP